MVNDVVIIDILPPSLEFVADSIIFGMESPSNVNILTGIKIGALGFGAMKVITFKAKVIKRPSEGYINNTARATFKCIEVENCGVSEEDVISNTVGVKVELAEVAVIKQTDTKVISREDVVKFTVKIINKGTLEAKNILFTDILPQQAILMEDTFRVNEQVTSVAQVEGIENKMQAFVGSLMPMEEILITYEIKVMSINCRGYFVNKAYVTFSYNLPGDICGEKTSEIDEESMTEVELGLSTFKQIVIDGYLSVPSVKPDIEEINVMSVTADTIRYHVIDTPIGRSNEGQVLSGHKLIVKGMLNTVIEYTGLNTVQSVHSAHYAVPFSTFVVLPLDYTSGSKVDTEIIVEDVYYKAIDVRTLFHNITLLVNVKVLSC